jgi:capsular exopolysaccharide synthesis family protein
MPEEFHDERVQTEMAGDHWRDLGGTLWRRKLVILGTIATAGAVGVLITLMMPPIYRSTTQVLVQSGSSAKDNIALGALDLPFKELLNSAQGRSIETQIALIQSKDVQAAARRASGLPGERIQQAVLEVKATTLRDTDVIEVRVESRDAAVSDALVRSIPEAFRQSVSTSSKAAVNNALRFAQDRLRDETEGLHNAELAFHRFKEMRRVVDLETEREAHLTGAAAAEQELHSKEVEDASARAQFGQMLKMRRDLPELIETPTTSPNTQVIESLKDRIGALQTQRAGLLVLHTPDDPTVQQLDEQITALQVRLDGTPQTVTTVVRTTNPLINEMDGKLADARARLVAATAAVARARAAATYVKAGLSQYSALETEQSRLKRDIDQRRATVASLSNAVESLSIRASATENPVEVVSSPGNPVKVSPDWRRNLTFALLLGLMLGVVLAQTLERLDDRLRAPDEASLALEAPVLAYVPLVTSGEVRLMANGHTAHNLMETFRLLRSNVQFAGIDAATQSLLVTSSMPGEGKSLTAHNLAVAAAINGRRVILVDADLRRPVQHRNLGLARHPGLTNVLIRRASLDEALQATKVPNLQLLACGHLPPNPAELLNSRAMARLQEELRRRADLIVFDSSPLLATADAQLLAAETDGVLFVVEMGQTRKNALRASGELLHQARARVLGVVLNKVQSSASAHYGYGYYRGYYHGYYGTYRYYSSYVQEVPPDDPEHKELAAAFESLPLDEAEEAPKLEGGKPDA